MMTPLESETLKDGFLVALACIVERRGGPGSIRAELFDGGRAADRFETETRGPLPPQAYLDLRRFLARVAAPPHVLVGCGEHWRQILDDTLGEHAAAYRVLDLRATATALAEGLKPGAGCADIAATYGMARHVPLDGPPHAWFEDLFWNLLGIAGARGMDWPGFLTAADQAIQRVAFDRYRFDEIHLRTVPEAPGVYILRDRAGRVLYVGKSGNLAQRLGGYFRDARQLDPKLRRIRDEVYDLEYNLVGSELEALLEENRQIEQHHPPVNVQRRIAENRSRYAPPLMPVALLAPSIAPGRIELFVFGTDLSAVQRRVDPGRPPATALEAILRFARGETDRLPALARAKDWGRDGKEICLRHFCRYRSRLQWIEVNRGLPVEELVTLVLRCAEAVVKEAPEPGEFLGEPVARRTFF